MKSVKTYYVIIFAILLETISLSFCKSHPIGKKLIVGFIIRIISSDSVDSIQLASSEAS